MAGFMQEKIAQILERVEKSMLQKDQRFTAPRRDVLRALLSGTPPLKAYDLVESMKGVKPMTVYRALDFLVAQGLVHRIESLNSYVPCVERHCAHTDSQYLICDTCGKVEELHNHAIDDYIRKKLAADGFQLAHTTMELHGTCEHCTK
jgi:Fur family zinc uptake transcriptional regulator